MATNELSNENGILHLRGEITFHNVTNLTATLEKILTADTTELDCSAITKADSSTIAFLIFAVRQAHRKKITLHIKSINNDIKTLIKLYGLENFLLPSQQAD